MDLKQIKELLDLFKEADIAKMVIKEGDFEVSLEKTIEAPLALMQPMAPVHSLLPQDRDSISNYSSELSSAEKKDEDSSFISSPMVGTFYASPSPEDSSFVKIGDKVNEETIVCIIEAMKVMNEVKAGISGIIEESLVDNGHPIEFGTHLFRVKPSP